MTLIKLPYVQTFTARGRRFHYFRKPGVPRVRLPGIPGSDEFMGAYQAALANVPHVEIGANRTMPGTVNAAVVAYYASAHFNGLSVDQQRFRRNVIETFRAERGDRPVKLMASHHIAAMLERITEPHARKNWLKAIRPMLQHAQKIGLIAVDPTLGIKTKLPKTEGFRVWEEEQIARFRAEHALGSMERLALELLLNTAQRRGDVIRLGRQHIQDGNLCFRQRKTGVEMKIQVLPELSTVINANGCVASDLPDRQRRAVQR